MISILVRRVILLSDLEPPTDPLFSHSRLEYLCDDAFKDVSSCAAILITALINY